MNSNNMKNLSYLEADIRSGSMIPDYSDNSLDYFIPLEVQKAQQWSLINNGTKYLVPLGEEYENDDASWIMACTFMIFTMQTGLGLVESGMCSMKNEVNILLKNVMDVGLGGFIFWAFGYGLVHGEHSYSTPYYGVGYFFFDPDVNQYGTGEALLKFFYNSALVSSSTSIISGGMAERSAFKPFIVYCSINTIVYCFPARWIWNSKGWLKVLGVIDNSGAGVVHQMAGFAALVNAYYLGPRLGVMHQHDRVATGNAKNCLMGLFMLWWAFLAFNAGSTFGISTPRWHYAARATVTTITSSFGGGIGGIGGCYIFFRGKMKVPYIVNTVYSSLVSITGCCFLVSTIEACFIGFMGSVITFLAMMFMEKLSWYDDPCATFAVHGLSGMWGMLAVGFFAQNETFFSEYSGLLHGGGGYLLSVQALAVLAIAVWTVTTTLIIIWTINRISPMRTQVVNELLGSDYSEHNILHSGIGIERAVDILKSFYDIQTNLDPTGNNLGHMMYLENNYARPEIDRSKTIAGIKKQQYQDASDTLSLLFGEDVTLEDVERHVRINRRIVRIPRKSEGGGAFFGRRPHQQFL